MAEYDSTNLLKALGTIALFLALVILLVFVLYALFTAV